MEYVPSWYHTTVCVYLTSLAIIGILLNCIVIISFLSSPLIRTPYNVIVINLAFADFVLASVGVTLDLYSLVQNGWVLGEWLCVASGVVVTTSGFSSILTLCVLAICRYGSIFYFGHITNKVPSYYIATMTISGIWLYSLALSIPPLFGFGRYIPDLSGLGCAPDWHSQETNKTYILYILIYGFIIPTLTFLIASLLTCVEARWTQISFKHDVIQRPDVKTNWRTFLLLLSMNLTYLTCWSPYAVLCITYTFISKESIGPMLSMIPMMTAKMSVCLNPFLYITLNPQFQWQTSEGSVTQLARNSFRILSKSICYNPKRLEKYEPGQEGSTIHTSLQPLKIILKDAVKKESTEPKRSKKYKTLKRNISSFFIKDISKERPVRCVSNKEQFL